MKKLNKQKTTEIKEIAIVTSIGIIIAVVLAALISLIVQLLTINL